MNLKTPTAQYFFRPKSHIAVRPPRTQAAPIPYVERAVNRQPDSARRTRIAEAAQIFWIFIFFPNCFNFFWTFQMSWHLTFTSREQKLQRASEPAQKIASIDVLDYQNERQNVNRTIKFSAKITHSRQTPSDASCANPIWQTGGEPSTWFPPGGLVEQNH